MSTCRPWWSRLFPCRPAATVGGLTAAELWEQLQDANLKITEQKRLSDEFKRQLDAAVRRNDNLKDLISDIRKLTEREM